MGLIMTRKHAKCHGSAAMSHSWKKWMFGSIVRLWFGKFVPGIGQSPRVNTERGYYKYRGAQRFRLSRRQRQGLDRFIDKTKARQRNIVFPIPCATPVHWMPFSGKVLQTHRSPNPSFGANYQCVAIRPHVSRSRWHLLLDGYTGGAYP